MDKKWWIALRNNKALKLYKKYLRHIINELHEREIKGHMYRKNLNADQILIEESSKDIDNYIKIKSPKKKNQNQNPKKSISPENKRDISLLYLCLLKFDGLLRYMYFQGLNHDDINKMAHFIKYTFRKKGTYVFRQFDKSDALYGVIKGKAVIRLVETNDFTKKYANEISNGGEFISNPPESINIQNFMSDCEEESEEEEDIQENKDNNDNKDNKDNKDNNDNNDNNIIKKKSNLKKNDILNNNDMVNENEILKKNDNINQNENVGNDNKIEKIKLKKLSGKIKIKYGKSNKNLKRVSIIDNNLKKVFKTDEEIDNIIEKKLKEKLKEKLQTAIIEFKNKKKKKKKNKIIKAIIKHQTPNEPLEGIILENFIKEFEIENFALTNGMCFGEWGLLYSIPRTTSIYADEDTHLFYLEKEYFNKTLLTKFLRNDSHKIKFVIHKFPIFKKNFNLRHIFTKIIPLFLNKDNIIYTPFDNAENIYLLYQGEGILVNLPSAKDKEDFFLKKTNWQIISRLQEGGIAGIESCLDIKNNKYENAFIITREFTTVLKINVKYFNELFKDFSKSLIPLYKSHQSLYKQIKQSAEQVNKINYLKRKFSLSKFVQSVLNENKKRNFSNDFQSNKLNINLDKGKLQIVSKKNNFNPIKIKFNSEKKKLNKNISKKLIIDNLSTTRKSTLSPLSSETDREKLNEFILNSASRNSYNINFYSQFDNNMYKTITKESSISNNHKRSQSSFSRIKNHIVSTSNKNNEKIISNVKKKLLNFLNIDTGMFTLPLINDNEKKKNLIYINTS